MSTLRDAIDPFARLETPRHCGAGAGTDGCFRVGGRVTGMGRLPLSDAALTALASARKAWRASRACEKKPGAKARFVGPRRAHSSGCHAFDHDQPGGRCLLPQQRSCPPLRMLAAIGAPITPNPMNPDFPLVKVHKTPCTEIAMHHFTQKLANASIKSDTCPNGFH